MQRKRTSRPRSGKIHILKCNIFYTQQKEFSTRLPLLQLLKINLLKCILIVDIEIIML